MAGRRIYEVWIGEQSSGKTYQIRRRIGELSARARISSVFVADRLGEYRDLGFVAHSWGEYLAEAAERGIPRVVVFCLGDDPGAYEPLFREAIEVGGVVLVLDEAYSFAPSGSTWRGSPTLKKIVFSGRHLPNAQGVGARVG